MTILIVRGNASDSEAGEIGTPMRLAHPSMHGVQAPSALTRELYAC